MGIHIGTCDFCGHHGDVIIGVRSIYCSDFDECDKRQKENKEKNIMSQIKKYDKATIYNLVIDHLYDSLTWADEYEGTSQFEKSRFKNFEEYQNEVDFLVEYVKAKKEIYIKNHDNQLQEMKAGVEYYDKALHLHCSPIVREFEAEEFVYETKQRKAKLEARIKELENND